MRNLLALALGILFALGLGVSGMVDPQIVLGFLDITGNWNPALMFVMASAIPIYMAVWFLRHRRTPWLGGKFPNPQHNLDRRLIVGASLFGIGWGLAGICPGPAVTILGKPSTGAVVFLAAVLVGMFAFRMTNRRT